jgi:crotonobetainyl-CoA:carnitine CoA-transferase CaiB-like acyl-CoA transferase
MPGHDPNERQNRAGPLAGLRVVDFSRYGPGLAATMMLSDLGAEVIHVDEPARRRREVRGVREDSDGRSDREQPTYAPNRNKLSIAIDLKSRQGCDIACRLAARADIVFEGFRPGVAKRLGIDYDSLSKINPRLIYCSISGYGQTGPYAQKAGHDLTYMAETGALMPAGGGRPFVPPVQIADFGGGTLHSLVGVLSALYRREITGKGDFIDAALTEGVFAIITSQISRQVSPNPWEREAASRLTGGAPFYNLYQTSDQRWLAIACTEQHFWKAFCELIESQDLIPALTEPTAWPGAIRRVGAAIGQNDLTHWCRILADAQLPHAAVRRLEEVVADPHFEAREIFVGASGDEEALQVSGTVRVGGYHGGPRSAVPRAGEHSRAVLQDLGIAPEAIDALVASGAIEAA